MKLLGFPQVKTDGNLSDVYLGFSLKLIFCFSFQLRTCKTLGRVSMKEGTVINIESPLQYQNSLLKGSRKDGKNIKIH